MARSTVTAPAKPSDQDPRRVPLWLLLSVWGLIAAVAVLQWSLGTRPDTWRWVVMDWGPWMVLAPIVIWTTTRAPIEQTTWLWALPLHLVLSGALTGGLGLLAIQLGPARGLMPMAREGAEAFGERRPMPRPEFAPARPPLGPPGPRLGPGPTRGPPLWFALTRGRGQFSFYWALVGMTLAVRYQRRSVERERRALAAEARLAEARLTALQAQLHPHFLFNTLHAISSLVYTKPAAADEMICALSALLRRVLETSDRHEVSLAEELELARSYISIQQLRFEQALQVRWEIPDPLRSAAVPTLLLQPLVENAVIHALEARGGQGDVTVRAETAGGRLRITVCDTGKPAEVTPLPSGKGSGVGLSNCRTRLRELYGDDHHFEFTTTDGTGARVLIEIPLRHLASA